MLTLEVQVLFIMPATTVSLPGSFLLAVASYPGLLLSTSVSVLRHGTSSYMPYMPSCMVFPSLLNAKLMSNNLFQTLGTL